MVDSESTTKEVINAELSASDLENLADGYDNVEIEGENMILRLSTESVKLSDRMAAVKEAYDRVYNKARRELK